MKEIKHNLGDFVYVVSCTGSNNYDITCGCVIGIEHTLPPICNHLDLDTIDGVSAVCAPSDSYGQHHASLSINCERLSGYSVEMLDDDSTFIRECRQYYKDKYGVSYED